MLRGGNKEKNILSMVATNYQCYVQMRTSTLLVEKNIFSKIMARLHGQGGGVIIYNFVRTAFMDKR